jgi:hypothetical protein
MGSAANQAKTRWNAKKYTQVKVSVAPEVASAFKAACEVAGVSMASELSQLMVNYSAIQATKQKAVTDFVSTRKKRLRKIRDIIRDLKQIRDAQEYANDNVPDNFRDTENFEASEETVAMLDDVIETLEGIY